jgi:acyl dehydratase
MKIFETLQSLSEEVGKTVAVSDWFPVRQEQIQLFAQATGDHQWIHTDEKRALEGPFKSTVAHGFLTLSMIPLFLSSSLKVCDVKLALNYGLNKVRFISPVAVNSRLRAQFKLMASEPLDTSGAQQVWEVCIEIEGQTKPACIAELVLRQYT